MAINSDFLFQTDDVLYLKATCIITQYDSFRETVFLILFLKYQYEISGSLPSDTIDKSHGVLYMFIQDSGHHLRHHLGGQGHLQDLGHY